MKTLLTIAAVVATLGLATVKLFSSVETMNARAVSQGPVAAAPVSCGAAQELQLDLLYGSRRAAAPAGFSRS